MRNKLIEKKEDLISNQLYIIKNHYQEWYYAIYNGNSFDIINSGGNFNPIELGINSCFLIDNIVEVDILSIDKRITSCIIENNDDSIYVKIWFKYKLDGFKETKIDGRQEFEENNVVDLFNSIIEFINKDHISFKIV